MKSLNIFLSVVSCWLLVTTGGESYAKPAEKPTQKQLKPTAGALDIVAVVGDKAISSFDLSSRIKFIIATTRISNTPDVIANIKPQVIRTLIDETLQLHEATKNGINVTEKEVDQAIAGIESQRGMPAGAIAAMLAANNVPEKTFRDQITAQIAWGKMLGKTVRSRIKISDDEVAMAQGRIPIVTENKTDVAVDIKEVEIAVINLAVDKPQRIAEVKKLGDRLYGELMKGASFDDVARQFSASGDAKPFWIRPEQLDKNVAQVLRNTKQGAITPPILSNTGFTIIKLVNIRANKTQAKAEKVQPKEPEKTSANLDKVRDYLFRQKFDLEAQKYLRNLRRETFIEVR